MIESARCFAGSNTSTFPFPETVVHGEVRGDETFFMVFVMFQIILKVFCRNVVFKLYGKLDGFYK